MQWLYRTPQIPEGVSDEVTPQILAGVSDEVTPQIPEGDDEVTLCSVYNVVLVC